MKFILWIINAEDTFTKKTSIRDEWDWNLMIIIIERNGFIQINRGSVKRYNNCMNYKEIIIIQYNYCYTITNCKHARCFVCRSAHFQCEYGEQWLSDYPLVPWMKIIIINKNENMILSLAGCCVYFINAYIFIEYVQFVRTKNRRYKYMEENWNFGQFACEPDGLSGSFWKTSYCFI